VLLTVVYRPHSRSWGQIPSSLRQFHMCSSVPSSTKPGRGRRVPCGLSDVSIRENDVWGIRDFLTWTNSALLDRQYTASKSPTLAYIPASIILLFPFFFSPAFSVVSNIQSAFDHDPYSPNLRSMEPPLSEHYRRP